MRQEFKPIIFLLVLLFISLVMIILVKKSFYHDLIIKIIFYSLFMLVASIEVIFYKKSILLDDVVLRYTYLQPLIISLFLLSLSGATNITSNIELVLVGVLSILNTYYALVIYDTFLSVSLEYIIFFIIKLPILWFLITFYYFHSGTKQEKEFYFSQQGKLTKFGLFRFLSYLYVITALVLTIIFKYGIIYDVLLVSVIILVVINIVLFEHKALRKLSFN